MPKLTRREVLALAAAGAAALSTESVARNIGGIRLKERNGMPLRPLGRTGENVSILTFGGFHLIEALPTDSDRMLNYYLDQGGNFIETARGYGDSEIKIGRVMKTRRADCFLSTKTGNRTKAKATAGIDDSLKRLNTDHLDYLFMHGIASEEELKTILSPDGALAAAEEARAKGKVRFISVTSHNPELLLKCLQSYPFDATMEWMNYYDYFNFPLIYDKIIPYCQEKNIGLIAMKPVADGLLYRNPELAFRWVWSLPIASVSAGNNTMELLKKNIALAKKFKSMDEDEKQQLYRTAPEYANYVCRRCEKCVANDLGLDIKRIFELEGYWDRQMYTGDVPDAAEFALRERLRFWFGQRDFATARYKELNCQVPKDLDPKSIQGKCLYGIDVPRKLRIAAWKLTGDSEFLG